MSKSNGLTPKFLFATVLALSLTALAAVFAIPTIGAYLKTQASDLVASAKQIEANNPTQAATYYQIAALLQPSNHEIIQQLAYMYVGLGHPDDAIAALKQLPFSETGDRIADLQFKSGQYDAAYTTLQTLMDERVTSQRLVAMSRTLLELNRVGESVKAAKDAVTAAATGADKTAAYTQLGLSQLVFGDDSGYHTTIAALGSSAAAQTLENAHAYQLALARELYAQGLLNTSERTLDAMTTSPTERYILLAQIKLAHANPSAQDLADANSQLVRATKLDPADIDAHKLLEEVMLKQGDEPGADNQARLIKSLESGLS